MVEREAGDDRVEAELVVELFERETAEDVALGRTRIDGGHVVTVSRKGESELAVSATDLEQASRRRRKLRSCEGVESLEPQAHVRSSESARAFCSSFPRSAWSSSSSSALNPASRRWLNACTARSISACFARPASVSSTLTARRSFVSRRRTTSPSSSRPSMWRVSVGPSMWSARASSCCVLHSSPFRLVRMNHVGTEPPTSASASLNARPTCLAEWASCKPIGAPDGRTAG